MSNTELFVTMASWEERFLLGAREVFSQDAPRKAIMYYARENAANSQENRDGFEELCEGLHVQVKTREVSFGSPADTWRSLQADLASQTVAASRATVDITTMPRDIIWLTFSFLKEVGCEVNYVYHKPNSYNKDWLSRDPDRPRLVYKLSGEARLGCPTTLIVLTGYDVRRTEQLIRFYEPKTAFLGIQTGSQYGNQSKNTDVHAPLICPDGSVERFDVDAYSADRGLAAIRAKLEGCIDDSNVVLSSLGPKLSAVALFQLHQAFPQVALAYAPSQEYNIDYSSGIGETVRGQL
ncbi:hypothetical protein GobsT_13930 [Gemmata obscuriglobus]|nr:hypothetical protein [Gemmata obscuriglobus]QEG26648.1 hypothetical protein GobsT_13930 [Gemmata obscuriglobus]VTS02232.1 Uncharacterized protein OS=Bacteroides oleiciplenus YIT 12058 GN=HMPREF9447_04404 PE=4 SV=1 [Gemmata obscuriglobus UQM 2246]